MSEEDELPDDVTFITSVDKARQFEAEGRFEEGMAEKIEAVQSGDHDFSDEELEEIREAIDEILSG